MESGLNLKRLRGGNLPPAKCGVIKFKIQNAKCKMMVIIR